MPDRALKDPSLDLPVVVFIHGDGRKARTKPLVPLYDGHGLIEASEEEIIYVTFNYRLGAFGFLAGKTMEEQAIPNVGLWDQRAVFQWVRDHISKINGDPTQVTAMGHSGGATSIISHLTAAGGTLDPLFHRAILLSPAFLPMWDRRGLVELRFQLFAMFAGCEGRGIECLRRTNSSILQKANRELTWIGVKGNFPVGPTPDGSYIRQLPALELASKNVWPIESLILSHTGKEAENLVAATDVTDNAAFEIFLNGTMPDYVTNSTLFGKIKEHYPDITYLKGSTYMEHKDRMTAFLRDWCVTCNIRWLVEAFGENKTWVMNYNMPPANHGADLLSLFFHYDLDPGSIKDFWAAIRSTVSRSTMNHVMKVHKSYIASFIRTGNPNKHRYRWRLPRVGSIAHSGEWKNPENISNGEHVNDVMEVDPDRFEAFDYALDENMPRSRCQFWKSFFVNVTIQGGYLPSAELKRPTGVRDRGMDDKNNITNKQKTAN